MQTAVDCNGSSSNSTTITTTQTETGTDAPMTQHVLVQSSTATATTTNTKTTTDHVNEAPTSVLRHRMTAATTNSSYEAPMKAPKNGLTHLIDATDYLGSNVQCMSRTPSPSPQASPSKRDKCKPLETLGFDCPMDAKCKTNTSSSPSPPPSPSPPDSCSSSKTTSNSASTTSSVIATPISKRNGNVFKTPEEDNTKPCSALVGGSAGGGGSGDGRAAALTDGGGGTAAAAVEAATTFRDSFKQPQKPQQLIKNNQMLPFENTSSSLANKQELSSGPSLAMATTMSSSATSSSINSNASNASLASMASSSASASASSATSTSSSITPPASATTPALLSPSSSTATTSSSSTGCSSAASASPATPPPSTKGFSISGDVVADAELLQWQDMPQYLQFNPYVLKGYRPLQTFKGCLLSLFYWHNETINILTHAIPIVYILAIVPGLMPWESGYRFLSFCHVFGSVAPWCGSFVYHLFMNIERGENVYYTLLKLDMVGIWVSQSFGALPLVTATTFCFPSKWKWLIILSYCLFSLWGLYKALTASSPWQRRLCFALPFSMRSLLTLFRTLGMAGGSPVALPHVYLQDAVSVIGGAIGAMRIPEKWFPGLVDYYLNSHNIMHVLVVLAVYSMHMATTKDFEWMSNINCEAFTNVTSKVLESTLNSNVEL